MDFKDLASTAGASAAAVGSVIAAFVAINQFTLRSRMRRIVAWTGELLKVEEDDNRKTALFSIRDRAAASMVASALVPVRHVAEGALWLAFSAFLVVQLIMQDTSMWNAISVGLGMFGASLQGVRRAVRMYIDRERVKAEYIDRVQVVQPRTDILAKMEGGVRSEFGWAALLVAGFITATFGVAWFISGGWALWLLLVLMCGLGAMSIAVAGVRKLGRRARNIPTLSGGSQL